MGHSFGNPNGVGRVHPKEDPQIFILLGTCLDPGQAIMFFLCPETSFHHRSPLLSQLCVEDFLLVSIFPGSSLGLKARNNSLPFAVRAVGIGGINIIARKMGNFAHQFPAGSARMDGLLESYKSWKPFPGCLFGEDTSISGFSQIRADCYKIIFFSLNRYLN